MKKLRAIIKILFEKERKKTEEHVPFTLSEPPGVYKGSKDLPEYHSPANDLRS